MEKAKKFFGLGPPCSIDILFKDQEKRKKVQVLRDESDEKETLCVFSAVDPVCGTVLVRPCTGKKIEYSCIKMELFGQIIVTSDRTEKYDFSSLVKELSGGGVITENSEFPFEFNMVDKPFESYNGINARLRYFVRFTITRAYSTNITYEHDFWVEHYQEMPDINNGIKMEVGIEDCLHIEFEYDKSKYHMQDVILGKIYFLLVRIKIKHMEIALIRRESTGSGPNLYNESETITRFETMDGAPVRGESVPVRMFLGAYPLTPTYKMVNNKFSVRYFLNLVLVDEEDRRYFKQQEVTLWRQKEE